LIELASDSGHLAALEVGNLDGAPTLGGADHGAEHELEDGLLAEGIGDDLEAPALLEEQALVVRIARRWVTGILKCAIQASKSSRKQATALSSSVSSSAATPSANSRAIARRGAW
jgi:hypothetical protein